MRLGILGSACDPPHKEHIAIGDKARRQLRLRRIILVPTKIPPHKDRPKVSSSMRLQMAYLAIRGKEGWAVSDMELRRRGKSYTRDTVAALKRKYPHDKLFWIVGADSLVSMPWKWKGGYDILDLCQFVVSPRWGFSLSRTPKSILKKVIILKLHPLKISSTQIRSFIHKGKGVRRLLDSKVWAYIKKNHLYL